MDTKAIKLISSVYFLLASLLTYAQQKVVDSNFHLYLLIGQSNMAGRGTPDAESKTVNPQILMLDSLNHWVPAADPVHFDKPKSVGVGPALGFAKEMPGHNKNIRIGLIPCAWGGSPIKVWEPGVVYLKVAHPYDDAIKRTKLAMQQGVLKGVLWHQGESDNDSVHAALYMEKLKALINRLRADLQQPNLPFVAGETGYFNKTNYINPVINQLPQQVPHTAVVSAKGLMDRGDSLHFDTPSARELGKRYAQAMKRLQSISDVAPSNNNANDSRVVVLCFDDAELTHYTIVAPLLKKYGFDATFMVCEMPWKTPGDSVYYMKWPQIAELNKMGFEIGSHTGHHKNMTKLSRDEKQQEISYIEKKCKEYGIPKPVSFAYPR